MNKIQQIRDHLKWITVSEGMAQTPMTDQCYWSDEVKRHAEEALTALSDLEKEQVWQPIQSAPRDGTAILICLNNAPYNDIIHTARWAEKAETYFGFIQDFKPAWYCIDVDLSIEKPTHWKTLPAPPEGE